MTVQPGSLRAALDAIFVGLPSRLRELGTGADASRAISDVYDRELAVRFAAASSNSSTRMALVATGGWARRELAPYSDIDLIVLHDRDEAAAKLVSDRLLYPLWDEKLAIGHAVREPQAAAKLAKADLATATALLDARHISGERQLTTELVQATRAVVAPGGNANEFIAALAAENKARHDRFGDAIYVLEPNLKQGIGALRDLATALWAAAVRWVGPGTCGNDVDHDNGRLLDRLVEYGHLTRRQGDLLANARDFQLRLRALVQLTAKRRFDQLTFEIQEAIAPSLYPHARPSEGEIRSAVGPAVEALMRDYYLHAREVVHVAERLLESARVPSKRKPRIARIDDSLITVNGELAVEDSARFAQTPSEMVRLFRVAVKTQVSVAGNTRDDIAEAIARDPAPLASDPVACRLFLEALTDIRDAGQPSALETMHQLGILSALMPGWAPCTARVQHDLYHVYTVDQHQLYAVAMQKRLARGELAVEHPLATELWRGLTTPDALLLATLLHDVGKPLGKGHAEKGAVIAGAVARKFGMPGEACALVEFLVRQHLTMSNLSQRRDLSDPEVVARFAHRIGTEARLVDLYLLTLCDAAMTAPDNLSAWKDNLLAELFRRTRAYLRGVPDLEVVGGEPSGRTKVIELLSDAERPIVEGIDPRLLVQFTPRQAARHVKLVCSSNGDPRVALSVHCYPMKGHSELAVVAPDKPGVLAAIAGVLTAHRVDVLGAILGHVDLPLPPHSPGSAERSGRLAIDVFFVRDLKGEAIADDDPRWNRVLADLRVHCGDAPNAEGLTRLIARRRPGNTMPPRVTPEVPTEINLHDDSTQATIIEVATRDRVGVLYAITHALAELGLDISLAKIATEGEKVADVFYVTRCGQRLTDELDRNRVVEHVRAAVEVAGGDR